MLSPDAKRLLSEHEWPGNVEELRLLAERLSVLYSGGEITAQSANELWAAVFAGYSARPVARDRSGPLAD